MHNERHARALNYLIAEVMAERFGITRESEVSSFQIGWQAQRRGVDFVVGSRVHARFRAEYGEHAETLREAWELGFSVRQRWWDLVINPRARNAQLRRELLAVLHGLETFDHEPVSIADVVACGIAQVQAVLDELRDMAIDGVLELQRAAGAEHRTESDSLPCQSGRNTRFVRARILRGR